ncbi:FG-GAP repeat domain-containing protein [Nannocystis bainbridge]|uniref:VCBS repeat-containing protein n=1 Tax=Nannocystis bainbridge TaxID=2995303 RepID=A0ABT5E5G2_9BACT|nr:VCBS repeat-containing protein [Nannocystis bainbridge]MDC0721086.1 VCBS repeat-containing protein [Nannocystis bainbridge]
MALRTARSPRLLSFSRRATIAALAVLTGGCGGDDACGSLAALCAGEARGLQLATRVTGAVAVDLDGDGVVEMVATGDHLGRQLVVGSRGGRRSSVTFEEIPGPVVALEREFAVLFPGAQRVAIFGLDGDGRLERRRDILLADAPSGLVSGDLDGDGRRELVVTMRQLGTVAVIDPRTGDMRTYPAGKFPTGLALGDVDGDAHLDVVVLGRAALQVLRGGGDGTLKPRRASPAPDDMTTVVLADHDGDGDLDALTRGSIEAVELHRNDGAGRFSSPISLPFGATQLSGAGLAAAPVTAAGLAGVSVPGGSVLTTWFGKGATWLGHSDVMLHRESTWVGGGTDSGLLVGGEGFVTPYAYARGRLPVEIGQAGDIHVTDDERVLATGDLDGDHLLDVVAAGAGQVGVFSGRAEPGLQKITSWSSSTTWALTIAELTGDGRPDVLVMGEQWLAVAMGGELGPAPPQAPEMVDATARELTPLRTGPDTPAVVVAVAANHAVLPAVLAPAVLLRFTGDGHLLDERVLGEGLAAARVLAVDFDDDGVDEPLILGKRDGAIVLVHASPDGDGYSLGAEHDLAALSGVPAEKFYIDRLAVGDLDGDGAPEVVASSSEGAVVVSGLADDAPTATVSSELGVPTHLRDLDGDGRLDSVALGSYSYGFRRGLGDGQFDDSQAPVAIAGGAVIELAARPDAQFDMVTLGGAGLRIHLLRDVMRPAEADQPFNFLGPVAELASADIDGDGHDDLVTACRLESGGVAVVWGSEDARLDRSDGENGRSENRGLAIGDLDGDGLPEVLSAASGYWVRIHDVGREPAGKYASLDFLHSLERAEDLAIDDVDDDGLPDILALAYAREPEEQVILYVAYGTERLKFAPWQPVAAVPGLKRGGLEVGDVDGDGGLDLLIRAPVEHPSLLLRSQGPRSWTEPQALPGTTALFGPRDADGRVELVSHEGTTVYRHVDGDPARRVALVQHELLVEGALRQVGDADGDGRYDLVTTGPGATYVWPLGDGEPRPIELFDEKLAAVQFPDIDGDGRPDIVGLDTQGRIVVRTSRR